MYFIKKHLFPKPLARVISHEVTRCLSVIAYSMVMVSPVPIKKSRSYYAEKWNITITLCSETRIVRYVAGHQLTPNTLFYTPSQDSSCTYRLLLPHKHKSPDVLVLQSMS